MMKRIFFIYFIAGLFSINMSYAQMNNLKRKDTIEYIEMDIDGCGGNSKHEYVIRTQKEFNEYEFCWSSII